MGRPKKTTEETKVEEIVENETKSHKMAVVYDAVEKRIVLLPESELSPRYKHV